MALWAGAPARRNLSAPGDAEPVGDYATAAAKPGVVPATQSQPIRACACRDRSVRQPARPPDPADVSRPAAAQPGKPAKRRHPVRNVFRVLLILLLLVILWLVGVPAYAWTQIARVDAAPSGQRPADQPGKTFLLVGSDSRAGLSKAEQKRLGTGSTGGQRTDTIMIVYVPPGGKPALISVPRDSYVDIPKSGKNKINAAYAFGGPQLLVQTVEQNTGLRMDGYMEIGFGGFVSIIDSLGGIRMCLPNAIKDRDSHIDLRKGCQTLTGTQALGYVRMRKADPRGDLGRVERQRRCWPPWRRRPLRRQRCSTQCATGSSTWRWPMRSKWAATHRSPKHSHWPGRCSEFPVVTGLR